MNQERNKKCYSEESEAINTAVLVLQYCCSNWKSARVEIYGLTANASLPLWSQDSSVQADSWEIHILAWFGRHYSMLLKHCALRTECRAAWTGSLFLGGKIPWLLCFQTKIQHLLWISNQSSILPCDWAHPLSPVHVVYRFWGVGGGAVTL